MASDLRFEFNETLEQARARNIRDALLEDVGRGDWTGQLLPAQRRIKAQLRVREPAVLCGRDWFDGVAQAVAVFQEGQIAVRTDRPKMRHQLAVELGQPVFGGA